MYLTTKSPSSYEDEDDDSNEEEQVVEQEQEQEQEQDDDLAEDDDDDSNQEEQVVEQEEDDLAEETLRSKRSLFQSGGDSSRNPKKQKMNEVVVALKAKAKRKKQVATDSRRSLFKKIWSEGDELVILEGLVNYKEKSGGMLVSTCNYETFLQSIKNLLSFECTVDQLKNKVKKLREKFEAVVNKQMSGVNNPNEGKPHEEQVYELSKTYWGDVAKFKGKAKVKESNELPLYYLDYFSKVNSTGYCNSFSVNLPTNLVAIASKKGWEKTIGIANADYLNEKWKDWMIADAELFMERCKVILDQTKMMLDLLKK